MLFLGATRANSRKFKAAETKKRIYESAIDLIKIHGLDNLTVDSIVEKAGVSKGAFYVHFDSKFALIAEYVKTVDLNYEEYLTSLPTDKKQSELILLVSEKIADTIVDTVGFDLIRIIYEAQLRKSEDTAILLNYSRSVYQIYERIIKQGVLQGEFKGDINIETISNHCIMSLRGMTYEWCIRFPDFDLKKEILKHFDILLSGIKNSRLQAT